MAEERKIRQLEANDYHKGYYELLPVLMDSPDIGFIRFSEIFRSLPSNQHIFVMEDKEKIIVNGMITIEQKFTHGGAKVGYIENIAVHESYKKQGLGKQMLQFLMDFSDKEACYKITLICTDKNISFYEPFGFEKRYNHMALYRDGR